MGHFEREGNQSAEGKEDRSLLWMSALRPGKIMAFDDPENPKIMEDFIRAIGAEPVIYPYRNECCGGTYL